MYSSITEYIGGGKYNFFLILKDSTLPQRERNAHAHAHPHRYPKALSLKARNTNLTEFLE